MRVVIAGLSLLWAATASADPSTIQTFMPPNNLHLQKDVARGEVTDKIFNDVIEEAIAFYGPIISSHGGNLKVNRLWSDDTVNASAQRGWFGAWVVNMYGGLARRPEITRDGFALVLCHELGHHLGGFPKGSGIFGDSWAAVEGQSDYFATLSCARQLWKDQAAINASARNSALLTPAAIEKCDSVWSTEAARNLCYRIAAGSMSLAKMLAQGEAVAVETPSTAVVTQTDPDHPKAQCRLDTYMAGAICVADFDSSVIPANQAESRRYTCDVADQYTAGTRPLCWYAP